MQWVLNVEKGTIPVSDPLNLIGPVTEALVKVLRQETVLRQSLDPYALWYAVMLWGRVVELESEGFGVLVELVDPGKKVAALTRTTPPDLKVRYVAGFVSPENLKTWLSQGTADLRKANVARFVLSVPRLPDRYHEDLDAQDAPEVARQSLQKLARVNDFTAQGPAPDLLPRAFAASTAVAETRAVLLGVIDDGCNFAAMLSDSVRLRAMWHQGAPEPPKEETSPRSAPSDPRKRLAPLAAYLRSAWAPAKLPAALPGQRGATAAPPYPSYGFQLDIGVLTGEDEGPLPESPPPLVEHRMGRVSNYFFPTPRWTHGAAISDIATGRAAERRARIECRSGPLTVLRREVVFVQLPEASVEDTSGGALGGHAIDGIDYVMSCARKGETVVVNLSYGIHGGSHDASAPFDLALLERLQYYRGTESGSGPSDQKQRVLHVVLPAGNGHELRTHAAGWISPKSHRTLSWHVLPDDGTETFVEFWFPKNGQVKFTLHPPAEVLLDAQERDGEPLREIEVLPGDMRFVTVPDPKLGVRYVKAFASFRSTVPTSKDSQMALVVTPSTARTRPLSSREYATIHRAPDAKKDESPRLVSRGVPGTWSVTLSNQGSEPLRFDSWIERDDIAPGWQRLDGRRRGRQAYFIEGDPADDPVTPEGTLNGIATLVHPRLHVIGAMRRDDAVLSRYSAAGPTRAADARVEGPDAVVAVDESVQQPGRVVAGMTAGSRVRIDGTSLAAAEFARLLFEHLSMPTLAPDPRLEQVYLKPPRERPRVAGEPRPANPAVRGDGRRRRFR